MSETTASPAELRLPVASLHALCRAVEAELGEDVAAGTLQRTGHAAADAVFSTLTDFTRLSGTTPSELSASTFWQHVHDFFAQRGWGHLTFDAVHPGIGALESSDWAEADPGAGALIPSCHFTAGLLANLLGRTAARDVGALEVECRSRGDLRCRFFFGGRPALERLYEALSEGHDADTALEGLQ